MFVHQRKIILNFLYVCQSVSQFTSLLKSCQYRNISSSGGYIFLNFWRHSLDISVLFLKHSVFVVCLSVCQLVYFLTEIMSIQDYLQFWMIYISEVFKDIPGIFLHYFKNILYFLYVCQSVSQFLISLPIGHFSGSTSETSGRIKM